ncbi:MAG: alpha/beta fold hydrolase [Winogradskyella sp.]|uniref:alpha/beta hydrolase n=1 Tax=Winogradskyella sp. TaxID=1883156 RepID=UPI000F3EEF4E|nr:alpha/beta hydrolase [Winogradskyella sp.]RNC84150.1 MAG: alpha/beta fold hydrolase [Winogradskyella sp.]
MNYDTKTYTTRDNLEIFYYHWKSPNKQPKGIVQISHGMGEHAGRYKNIAEILQKQGYEVYANDHRIHGKSVTSVEELGVYDGANYFDDAVEDMKEFADLIKKEHPNEKLILFGHSMGSFFSRDYVTKYGDDVKLLVLSGTASFIKFMGTVGLIGANVVKFFKGGKPSNDVLKAMFFNEFSKKFKPNRTKVDWISSDENEVDLFDKDPLRIEDFSTKVFIDIISGNKKVNEREAFKTTPKGIPIYMFAGESDPVGEMGKGVRKVAKQYKRAGIKDLTLKMYKGRHEMLNEVNKIEVEKDFINWLNAKVEAIN